MKRTLIILLILVLAAGAGFAYIYIDDAFKQWTHPIVFEDYVEQYADAYAVPREIVYAVMKCESSFKSDAVSPKGAVGLMQITPDTYAWLCTKIGGDGNPELLYNPEINIKYGTYFLSSLFLEFGTWDNAFAAYNAGRSRVTGWLKDERYNQNGKLVNIPYPETEEYVIRVKNAVEVYRKLYFSKGKEEKE